MVSTVDSSGYLLCVLVIFLLTTTNQAESANHSALFVFGDSIYDPGNNNFLNISSGYKANFPPYGETFFKNPTGRFSDGRLIPDFVAKHAGLPYWKPYLAPGEQNFVNGANFASASACVIPANNPYTLNLDIQVGYFKNVSSLLKEELGDVEAKKLLMNAVYLSSIGGVDYWIYSGTSPDAAEKEEYVKIVIGNLTNAVKEIYELGGRKFAFQNVAPMGCSPNSKQTFNLSKDECFDGIEEFAELHNKALVNVTKELKQQLPGFKYLIFDYFNLLYNITSNPEKYGFREGNVACCGSGAYRGSNCGVKEYELCTDPNDYVYFDGGHLTDRCNAQLTDLLWRGGTNITAPLNMKQLFELEPEEIKNFAENDEPLIDE